MADSITFKTDGVWKADELSGFASAVDRIYRAFLAVYITRQSTPSIEEEIDMSFRWWSEYSRRLPFPPPDTFYAFSAQRSSYLAFIYENIHTIAPDDQLNLGKVRMGSPGYISFEGIGEVIHQLRETIKDARWRDRHERERSEMEMQQSRELHKLEVLKRAAELYSEHGEILAGPANKLAADVLEDIGYIERLGIEGKVQDVETDTEDTEVT